MTPVVEVQVKSEKKESTNIVVLALIDTGAQISAMSKTLIQEAGLSVLGRQLIGSATEQKHADVYRGTLYVASDETHHGFVGGFVELPNSERDFHAIIGMNVVSARMKLNLDFITGEHYLLWERD